MTDVGCNSSGGETEFEPPARPERETDGVRDRCLRLLERWPRAIERHLYRIPGKPKLGCFGPGHHGHWAMQANNTAAAALAVLGMDPRSDFERGGMSRDEVLAWALRLLRFALHAHGSNGGSAADLHPWGYSWISGLCLERMMHGVEALDPLLNDTDRDMLRRVLVSESDWLVDRYQRGGGGVEGEVTAGLTRNNHPESNIWNGCVLTRTALMVPDSPRGGEYIEQGTRFLLNGISLEADSVSDKVFLGRTLSDWHMGANFFPSLALNHHGYLNIGYMAICLSNVAMMHFSCRHNGWEPPAGLYHHARALWRLVKTCTFPDGRLLRIGGDTRARYCYCQDYALPVWSWAIDMLDDSDAERFERGWLDQVKTEVTSNPDDSFLSGRLARLEAVSPLYYTRLEGDRAAALSMAACWHARHDVEWRRPEAMLREKSLREEAPLALCRWSDDFHHACLVKGTRRTASWVWNAAEKPQGLCLPSGASAMAEWRFNLASRICGIGMVNDTVVETGQCEMFDGGFATCGSLTVHSMQPVAEGDLAAESARVELACAALPDDGTMVIMQRARALGRGYLRESKGLFLQIPNDCFNAMRRSYRTAGGILHLTGVPGKDEVINVRGNWVEVDGVLSVHRVYGPALSICRPAGRQVGLRPSTAKPHVGMAGGTLYADEICCGCRLGPISFDAGQELFDLGVALVVAPAEGSLPGNRRPGFEEFPVEADVDVKGMRGFDVQGNENILLANFAARITEVVLRGVDPGLYTSLTGNVAISGDGKNAKNARIHMPPLCMVILRRENG